MPGRPSLPAIPELLEAAPGSAVVVMTQHDDPEFARVAAERGARAASCSKRRRTSELVEAVRAAVAGRTYLNPSLGARLAAAPPRPARARTKTSPVGSTFAGHRIDAIAGAAGWASSIGPPT